MNRRFIIIVLVVLGGLGLLLAFLLSGGTSPSERSMPAREVTPSLAPDPHDAQEEADTRVAEAHQEEGRSNPVLTNLPHHTHTFSLNFDGSEANKYVLLATVYYINGKENPQVKIEQMRPAVIQYLRGIGQPDGTYVLNYEAAPTDNSYNLS